MKKLLLSFFLITVFGAYVLSRRTGNSLPSATPGAITIPGAQPNAGRYRDGIYVGKVADAYYGNVQIKATVQGGAITDVAFLQYPNDRRTSIEINSQAMPMLRSEAISVQTAAVDIVSGATQTSEAFRESLASALSQAVN